MKTRRSNGMRRVGKITKRDRRQDEENDEIKYTCSSRDLFEKEEEDRRRRNGRSRRRRRRRKRKIKRREERGGGERGK